MIKSLSRLNIGQFPLGIPNTGSNENWMWLFQFNCSWEEENERKRGETKLLLQTK